jgi:hypothetical protein
VRNVASIATHVEGCVSATLCRNIQSGRVATQAEVLLLIARLRLQQLVLIIGDVRVVALEAISRRRWVNLTFDVGGIFVGVAGKTQSVGSGRDQLDVGYISNGADLVAAGATHRDGGVHRLAFGLIFVTGQASGRIGFRIQRHWMLGRRCAARKADGHDKTGERSKEKEMRWIIESSFDV